MQDLDDLLREAEEEVTQPEITTDIVVDGKGNPETPPDKSVEIKVDTSPKKQPKETKKSGKEKVENIQNKEIIENTLNKNKKHKKKNDILDPSLTAKDALSSVNKITHTIEIDTLVDKLLQRNDYNLSKQFSFTDAIDALETDKNQRDAKLNELITDLTENGANLGNLEGRRLRYNEYQSSIKKLPILNKILKLYTAHVISPDDFSKISLKVIPVNTVLEDDESIRTLVAKYMIILNKINLEKMVYDIIYGCFYKGDYFIEIQSSKRSLIQTLYNLQIPITESNEILKNIDNIKNKKMMIDSMNSNNTKLILEETRCISEQIDKTSNIIQETIDSILTSQGYHNGILSESKEFINDTIILNTINYLYENLVGKPLNEDDIIYKAGIFTNGPEFDINRGNVSNIQSKNKDNKDIKQDLKHVMDALPIEASLTNINLKCHEANNIVVLELDDICYGYLEVKGYIDNSLRITTLGRMSPINNNIQGASIISEKNMSDSLAANFVNQLSDYFKEKFSQTNQDGTTKFDITQMAPGLQQLISDILNSDIKNNGSLQIRYIPPSNMQHFKRKGTNMYAPYGESLLDDLIFMARLLLAQNIADTLNKVSRVGSRLKFTVKGNTHQQAENNINKVKNAVSRSIVSVDELGSIDTIPSQITNMKAFYIPSVNGEEQLGIDNIQLNGFDDTVNPYNRMEQQLITSADIPPAILGFDQMTNSKAHLAQEYLAFSLNVISAQKEFAEQFSELLYKIYLALYLKTKSFDPAFKRVKCTFDIPRGIMLAMLSENITNLSNIMTTLVQLGIPQEEVVAKYMPELITNDVKLSQTKSDLNKKRIQSGPSGNANPEDGSLPDYAPFDLSAVPPAQPQQAPEQGAPAGPPPGPPTQ